MAPDAFYLDKNVCEISFTGEFYKSKNEDLKEELCRVAAFLKSTTFMVLAQIKNFQVSPIPCWCDTVIIWLWDTEPIVVCNLPPH